MNISDRFAVLLHLIGFMTKRNRYLRVEAIFTRRRHLLYFEKYFSEKKKEFMFEVMRTILKVCSLANIFIGKNKIIKKKCNSLCFNSVRFISSGRNGFIFIESKLITSTTKHGTRTFLSRLRRKIVLRFGLIGNCRHASLN